VDALEARVLPAGSVTVQKVSSPDGIDLVITGDGSANKIEIYQTSLDNYIVYGRSLSGATRINGVSNGYYRFTLSEITDDIRIDLGGNNDQAIIRGTNADIGDLDVQGSLIIDMGTGNDTLTMKYLDVWNNLSVDLGTGTDTVTASSINVDGDASFFSSTTSRTLVKQKVNLTNFHVGDVLDIDLNYSLAVVNLVNTNSDELYVELGNGNDKLNIKTSKSRLFDLNGGDGNDNLNFYRNLTSFYGEEFLNPTFKDITYS
jgi:hypothetical protein